MKKRILSIAAALTLCLELLPVPAAAESQPIPATGLYIQSGTDRYGILTTATPSVTYTTDTGTVSWDCDSKVLTLDNVTLTISEIVPQTISEEQNTLLTLNAGLSINTGWLNAPLTIRLVGENTITGTGSMDGSVYGIYVNSQGKVTITGDGSLTISNRISSGRGNIAIDCYDLELEPGATLTASGGDGVYSHGLQVTNSLIVGGTLRVSGGNGTLDSSISAIQRSTGLCGALHILTVEEGGVLETGLSGEYAYQNDYGTLFNYPRGANLTVGGIWRSAGTKSAVGLIETATGSLVFADSTGLKGSGDVRGTGLEPGSVHDYAQYKYVEIAPETGAEQAPLTITGLPEGEIRYGDTFRLDVSGGSGSGAVTWKVTSGNAAVGADSTITVTGVGDITVTATKAGDAEYAETSADCSFTAWRAVPRVGTVTCAEAAIHPGTRPEDVTLIRTDTAVPGVLALDGETRFALGEAEYHWIFTPDDQTLYETVSGTVSLAVTAAALDSISVTARPGKTSYTFGEPFESAGMTVTAVYADGTTAAVTPAFDGALAVGQTCLLLSYTEGGVTRTCTLDGLTVRKRAGLSLTSDISVSWNDTGPQTIRLDGLLPSDCGEVTGITASFDPSGIIGFAEGDRVSGTVSWALSPDLEAGERSAVLTVAVETQNYDTITIAAKVQTTLKTPVTVSGVTAQSAVYDGTAHTGYIGTPQAEGYRGGYTITYSGGSAPVNAGAYTVTISIPEEDDTYFGSLTLDFTVEKAVVTVKAEDKTVTAGAAMPELTAAVTGLAGGDALKAKPVLSCDADLSRAGSYPITASGAEVPGGGNYESAVVYQPGTLTVRAAGSGGSGGSDGSSGSTASSQHSGGTTVTQKDPASGTVTQTTTWPDGSSVVKTTCAEGSSTVSVRADGAVEADVSLSTAAVAAAQAAGTSVPLPMPAVPAGRDTGSALVITVNTGSREPLRVEIPVQEVTPGTVALTVHPDGTEEPVKTSVPTENGLAVSLPDGAVVKVLDNSREFIDITRGWIKDAADFVSARTILVGTSRNTFSPADAMSRSMMATALARLDGLTASGPHALETGMSWAVEHGISDGSAPHEMISREQLVTMLYRYAGQPKVVRVELDFQDADQISEYAVDAFQWAVGAGLISGIGNKTLAPQGGATRGQAAAVIMRFCLYMAG